MGQNIPLDKKTTSMEHIVSIFVDILIKKCHSCNIAAGYLNDKIIAIPKITQSEVCNLIRDLKFQEFKIPFQLHLTAQIITATL